VQKRYISKIAGYFAAISILAAALVPGKYVLAAAGMTAAALLIIDRGAFGFLGRKRFWVWLIGGTAVLPLLGGGHLVELWGVTYSLETMAVSLRISARGLMIFAGMTMLRRHISPQAMANLLFKMGMRKAGQSIPLAFHLAPVVMEAVGRTYAVWKQRGGWQGKLLPNLGLLAAGMQVQLVREAEDLAAALFISRNSGFGVRSSGKAKQRQS